jgi:hypothetical protein
MQFFPNNSRGFLHLIINGQIPYYRVQVYIKSQQQKPLLVLRIHVSSHSRKPEFFQVTKLIYDAPGKALPEKRAFGPIGAQARTPKNLVSTKRCLHCC